MVFNTSFEAIQCMGLFYGIWHCTPYIFALRKRAFLIPCPVVLGFGSKIFLPLRQVYGVYFSSKILFMKLGLEFLSIQAEAREFLIKRRVCLLGVGEP